MKIVFVLHQFLPRHNTGTENYSFQLGRALTSMGHTVHVFTFERAFESEPGSLVFREESYGGLKVGRVFYPTHLYPLPLLTAYYNPVIGTCFGEYLDSTGPDIVHFFHCMNLGANCIEEVRARNIPLFLNLMDFWFLCPGVVLLGRDGEFCQGPSSTGECIACMAHRDGNYRHLKSLIENLKEKGMNPSRETKKPARIGEFAFQDLDGLLSIVESRSTYLKECMLQTDGIISPSRFLRNVFEKSGIPEERIALVPYGIDQALFRKVDKKVERAESIRFGFMGSLSHHKGVQLLVKVFKEFPESGAELWIYGKSTGDDSFARSLEASVSEDERIHLKGPFLHEKVGEVLQDLDFLIVPSLWYENTPFVVLEALASKTPVIGSDTDGISELIQHGSNGLLFQRGNGEDLLKKLHEAVEKRTHLEREIVSGHKVLTIEENAQQFLAFYEGAIQDKRGVSGKGAAERSVTAQGRKDRELYNQVLFLSRVVTEMGGEGASSGFRLLENVKRDLHAHKEALREKEEDLCGHRAKIETIQKEKQGLQKVEAGLRKETAAKDQQIRDMGQRQVELQSTLNEKEHKLSEYAQMVEALKGDLEGHRKKIKNLSEDLEGHRVKVSDLENDLAGHREMVDNLRMELNQNLKVIDEQQRNVASSEERAKSSQEGVSRLSKILAENEKKSAEALQKIKEKEEQLAEVSGQLLRAEDQIVGTQQQVEEVHQRLERVRDGLKDVMNIWYFRPLRKLIERRVEKVFFDKGHHG